MTEKKEPAYFMYFPGNYRWSAAFINMIGSLAYRKGVDCFHRHAALTDAKIEIVEVPYENGSLPGYFVHAQNGKGTRAPCVVFFDGLDVTKEIQFVRGVPDLVNRGISCLAMAGPGSGEAIRFRNYYLRHDYERAGR